MNMKKIDIFKDIKSLIFKGFLTETLKFDNFVIVIRTISSVEETSINEMYQILPKEYNLLAAVDTIKYAIYSINGTRIDNASRELITSWPKQITIKIFKHYLKLIDRIQTTYKLMDDFVKTDESRLRWSVIKATKTSINSTVITGDPDLESKGLSFIQQLWIHLNLQNDEIEENKIQWARTEYMTDSICTFINPKAMRQVQGQKKLAEEENIKKEHREEIKEIQEHTDEKIMIENTADELFDNLQRKSGESVIRRNERVAKALEKVFKEDEHDKIIREYEEFEFCRQLRIKKENTRRSKILYQKKLTRAVIVNMPPKKALPKGINVGFQQISTIGDDVFESKLVQDNKNNVYFINGVDYSEVIQITSFSMLKRKDELFKQIVNESDEETQKYIQTYIDKEKDQSEIVSKIKDIKQHSGGEDFRDKLLNVREGVLAGKISNSFENRQKEMIDKLKQNDVDEIRFGE